MAHILALAIGLLKPRPDTKNRTTPIQRTSDNKLLDLNILRIIHGYLYTPFYFTSQNVAVQHNIIIANDVNSVTLKCPGHMCELSDGCVAVTEWRGMIRIFSDGVLVQSIGSGIVSQPVGICTNSSDQLFVTDESKHQVHVFARDGSHIRSFGSQGSGNGQLWVPYGVCVNSKGHILVAEYGNHRISVFDSEGNFVRKFNNDGSGDGQLSYPIGVRVDGDDNMYVAEYNNHRVTKFSSSGAFVCKFGSQGSDPGQFFYPYDICVTRDGKYIVVAEWGNNRVQVLSGSDGSFVASYGSKGSSAGQFYYVAGCTITSDGRILASDYYNNRIHEIRKPDKK
jgi:DNA-binding beta-propeller fold protein YncE